MGINILYVLTCYPALTETFIAREMQQLSDFGYQITICSLRTCPDQATGEGLRVSGANELPLQRNSLHIAGGLVWALRHRRSEMFGLLKDWLATVSDPASFVKLAVILLLTCRIAHLLTLKDERPAHIRAHFLFSGAVSAMWLARFLDVPYSLTVHTTTVLFHRSVISKAVRHASFVVADTLEAKQLLETLKGGRNGVYLIRDGVPLKHLPFRISQDVQESLPIILAVGSLQDKKGFDILVRACAMLRGWGILYRCEIVGDGPEKGNLKALIAQYDLREHVRLLGSLPFSELLGVYSRATVLVVPSRTPEKSTRDGLPTVLIEAMAQGIPVVATDFGGIPDLVRDGETGLLVSPGDVTELALAIKTILSAPLLRASLAWAGRSKVDEEYSLDKSCRQLESLIVSS